MTSRTLTAGQAMEPAPGPQFDKIASVTIQGGAVYGLSLLGQLQAVLDEGYDIAALAGTSAGAIVATLYWAGLKPADIRQFFEDRAGRAGGVTGLLDGRGPSGRAFTAAHLGRLGEVGGRTWGGTKELFTGPWWSRAAAWACLPLRPLCHLPAFVRAVRDIRAGRRAVRPGGLFPGEVFEDEIDRLIRSSPRVAPHIRPGGLPAEGHLTFGHLWGLLEAGEAYFPALILTATDLCTGRLLLVDSTDPRFADVPVARAVRASGGFPLFFRPVEVELPDPDDPAVRRTHSLVDGGVICNFPGYLFSRRRRREQFGGRSIYTPYLMRPWVNIGLRLVEPTPAAADPVRALAGVAGGVWGLLSAGTRTHLETELAESTVDRLFSVGQPFAETGWPHGLLDFDRLTRPLVGEMFDRGRAFARDALRDLRFARPPADRVEPALGDFVRAAAGLLGDPANTRFRLRATVFVPDDLDLVLAYRANMDGPEDTDRDLRLEYWQGLVGFCFVRRRPVVCNLARLAAAVRAGRADAEEAFGLTADIRARVRADRTWLMTVPVFDPETADTDLYGDNPEVGVSGLHYAELDSPLDGALFGVLSLDAALAYGNMTVPADATQQATDPRVLVLRDMMVAAAWRLGKVFSAHFAAVSPDDQEDEYV